MDKFEEQLKEIGEDFRETVEEEMKIPFEEFKEELIKYFKSIGGTPQGNNVCCGVSCNVSKCLFVKYCGKLNFCLQDKTVKEYYNNSEVYALFKGYLDGKKRKEKIEDISKALPLEILDALIDPTPKRAKILDKAKELICGDREEEYGSPKENFTMIANMWTNYLGHEVTASDVAILMAILKICRIANGKPKEDTYLDGAAYLALAFELIEEE